MSAAITSPSLEAREHFIRTACERNTRARVEAFLAKVEAGLTAVGTEVNPLWLAATFELSLVWPLDGTHPNVGRDPYPYRYDDIKAGQRHAATGKQQPECIPFLVTVWSDGSKSECLWGDPLG